MSYVFDTSAFVVLFENYYRGVFKTLWDHFDEMVNVGEIVSTREVKREIEDQTDKLTAWMKDHSDVFDTPTAEEGVFVGQIYQVRLFQDGIEQKKILKGGKNADPFVIAKAKITNKTVVTLEREKPNSAKIPNICKKFGIKCLDLESFMKAEDWNF
ncbi:MAG: DUF4411 family protein [Gammaproteobacteria bacterium]|nr:DUF4411 family protein [Gammaproteobacteria bacterium]